MNKLVTTGEEKPDKSTPDDFNIDVQEYKDMEAKVTQDFLNGVIKLGEILQRQRLKWKAMNRWTEYIESIGRTVASANQFIRIYEYSLKNAKALLDANLTNWAKLNMFLSLPEELQEKVAGEISGHSISTDEFRETVSDLKEDEVVTDDDTDLTKIPVPEDNLSELIAESTLADVRFMAKKLIEEFNKSGFEFTNNCLVVAEGFLSIEKAIRDLQPTNIEKLTDTEKAFWLKATNDQLTRLKTLLNK